MLEDVPKGEEWGRLVYLQARYALVGRDPTEAASLAAAGAAGARAA